MEATMTEANKSDQNKVTVGKRDIIIEAMPLGKLKKTLDEFRNAKASEDVADMFARYLVLTLQDANNKDGGLTIEFFKENISLPAAKHILGQWAKTNGLPDFFQNLDQSATPQAIREKELTGQ
jgi:hypothetical protein